MTQEIEKSYRESKEGSQEFIKRILTGLVEEGYATGIKRKSDGALTAAILPTSSEESEAQRYLAIFDTSQRANRYYIISMPEMTLENSAKDKIFRRKYAEQFAVSGSVIPVESDKDDNPDTILNKLREPDDDTGVYGFRRIKSDTDKGQEELFKFFEEAEMTFKRRERIAQISDQTFIDKFTHHAGYSR